MTLGPFEMTADRIVALGDRYSAFINRLLDVERSAYGLAGHLLRVTIEQNTPDGGVDASTRDAPATDWLPPGDTAWQFKRTGLGPKACADELEGAGWAHEYLRRGGSYVIALGQAMTDEAIETRRAAIVAKAIELKLISSDDPNRIRVYDANALARWASRFPALAVSRLSGGPGAVAIDHENWSHKREYQSTWTADASRETAIRTLRDRIKAAGIVEIRVQGDQGLGKTRLVLEALRDPELSPLVAYVDDERAVSSELLEHLIGDNRTAVLVVDECPAERHIKLVQRLPQDPAIKLITIGPGGSAATRTPVVAIEPMPEDVVEQFLTTNYRSLSAEARRFVAAHSRGNLRWTIVLAERVTTIDAAQAADLIARNDIEQFITTVLPEGRDFFFAAVLALLERVGWDRELHYQLEILATFAGRPLEEAEAIGRDLENRGLLVRHGRLRSIEPHPLAVFLAAQAWRSDARRIVEELLPRLDEGMALSLFQRAADLGRFEPARTVLPALLGESGPFASLERIEAGGLGRILTQLAIVLPEEVGLHLAEQIESASLDSLRAYTKSRRDLVWTLEKIAWHRNTFERAANALLRLALSENETFANNATGTWLSLFGTMLPGTAATPDQRMGYLRQVATSGDPAVRKLAIQAASHTFGPHEAITVSAELQGGVLVEPRGTPETYDQAFRYRSAAVDVLESLVNDDDADVARSARDALVASIHPLLDDPIAGPRLFDALARLESERVRIRREVEHLLRIYDRTKSEEAPEVARLEALRDLLPAPTPIERIEVLSQVQRWDMPEGALQGELDELVNASEGAGVDLIRELLRREAPAAWELGHALAGRPTDELASHLQFLIEVFDANPAALPGFLSREVEKGDSGAFDDFLDGDIGAQLNDRGRMFVAVRGPVTDRARHHIREYLRSLRVADGIFLLFGWQRNLSEAEVADLLVEWIPRIVDQRDYNAVVDWVHLFLHPEAGVPDVLRSQLLDLLLRRAEFPEMGQQQWDWARLASRFIDTDGVALASIILDGVEGGTIMVHEGDEDAQVLVSAASLHPQQVWDEITSRLAKRSWRIRIQLQGWLLASFPAEVIERWVGHDLERGRVIAGLTPVRGQTPSPLVRYLLVTFPDDTEIGSALSGNFQSGFWSGPESAHLAGLMDQLTAWREDETQPLAVREWARRMVEYLGRRKAAAEEEEAEERF